MANLPPATKKPANKDSAGVISLGDEPSPSDPKPKKKFKKKIISLQSDKIKIALGVLGLFLLVASVPAAVYLVQQRQEIRKRAVPVPWPSDEPYPSTPTSPPSTPTSPPSTPTSPPSTPTSPPSTPTSPPSTPTEPPGPGCCDDPSCSNGSCDWECCYWNDFCKSDDAWKDPSCCGLDTPTPGVYYVFCDLLGFADQSWNRIINTSTIAVGDTVYLILHGMTDHSSGIDQVQFRIDSGTWQTSTNNHLISPDNVEFFYLSYPVTSGSHTFEGRVHSGAGWSEIGNCTASLGVTETPTETPAPSVACGFVKTYDENMMGTSPPFQIGQSLFFGVNGNTDYPDGIARARFKITIDGSPDNPTNWCNGSGLTISGGWCETTNSLNNAGIYFYIPHQNTPYQITSGGQYGVESQVCAYGCDQEINWHGASTCNSLFSVYSAQCEHCYAYDTGWTQIPEVDLDTITIGQTVYFATYGTTDEPQGITMARFRINDSADASWCSGSGLTLVNSWCESSLTHDTEYYIQYTIPSAGAYTVGSEVYNPALGWY